jgi:hypothetical protein
MWRGIIFQVRARVLRASSLPARNGLAGGGLVGSIFRGRWCVTSTCLCLLQLRERIEQQSGDFNIARLGGVAAINIQRLLYRPSDVVRDAITSHLFVLRHPAAPPPIRLQAARTLNDILATVPRYLMAAPSYLQATVQRRVLDVLAHSRSCWVDSHRALTPGLIGGCRSTLASYVAGENLRGNLRFTRYALHNMIMGCELYLINAAE